MVLEDMVRKNWNSNIWIDCIKCLPGTYSNIFEATYCEKCPPGTTSNYMRTECFNCTAGHCMYIFNILTSIIDSPDGNACLSCPIGTYADKEGSSECIPCPIGTYSDHIASKKCKKCPNNSTTESVGSTSIFQCILL